MSVRQYHERPSSLPHRKVETTAHLSLSESLKASDASSASSYLLATLFKCDSRASASASPSNRSFLFSSSRRSLSTHTHHQLQPSFRLSLSLSNTQKHTHPRLCSLSCPSRPCAAVPSLRALHADPKAPPRSLSLAPLVCVGRSVSVSPSKAHFTPSCVVQHTIEKTSPYAPVLELLVRRQVARRELRAQSACECERQTPRVSNKRRRGSETHKERKNAPPACQPPSFCCPTAACHVGRCAVVMLVAIELLACFLTGNESASHRCDSE